MRQAVNANMNFMYGTSHYKSSKSNSKKQLMLFRSKLTYVLLAVLFVSIVGFNFFSQDAYGSQAEKVIIVQPGDSLWSIAQANYPDENTQKAIYYISKANKLDSSNLKIGTELHLPVF